MNQINHHTMNTYHMIGIDLSFESIKIAKQKNEGANFIVCDIEAPPFKNKSLDMIIVRNVLHHLPNSKKVIDNLIALLNPKGIMIIDDKISGNPFCKILDLVYNLMPYHFKRTLREKGEHIDLSGRLPYRAMRRPKYILNLFKRSPRGLCIKEVEYHGFFLFLAVLSYLSYFFPQVLSFFTPQFYQKLYSIERRKPLRWSAISMTIVVAGVY